MDGTEKLLAIIAVAFFLFLAAMMFAPFNSEGPSRYEVCMEKNSPAQCKDVK